MDITPVTLEGTHVRLEPVRLDHVVALWRIGADEAIWRYMPRIIRSEEDMRTYIETELRQQQAGLVLRFVTIAKAIEQPVGSTSYLNIDRQHCRLEIGGTWITPSWQRSAINTEAIACAAPYDSASLASCEGISSSRGGPTLSCGFHGIRWRRIRSPWAPVSCRHTMPSRYPPLSLSAKF